MVLALPDQSTTGAPDAVAGVLDPLLDDADIAVDEHHPRGQRAMLGEQQAVTLADGSRVLLNSGSALTVAFTDRERRVLRLAGEGKTAGEIATELGLSHGTVRNYLSECIGKLGVANRIEAYRLARQKGWL